MKILPDILVILGFITFCGGLWWIYEPAALIIGGILLMIAGLRMEL